MSTIRNALVSSWLASGLSAALLVAGVLGSVVSADLQQPFEDCIPSLFGRFLIFAVVITLTVLVFFLRQREVDRRREDVQRRLEVSQRELDKLPDLIRTMPPKEFLQDLGISTEKCQELTLPSCGHVQEEREQLLTSLRTTLESIAILARNFDDPVSSDAAYCANIMVYVTSSEAADWAARIKFVSPGVTLSGLQGVLVLCHDLIAVDSMVNVSESLAEFALPVPIERGKKKEEGGAGWEVLPGAPIAYSDKAFQHYGSASQVAGWVRDFGNFPESVRAEIEAYFNGNKDIGGLVSVPLFVASETYKDRADREVLGVLNFHWSSSNRLHLKEAAEIFSEAIFPLRLILSQQLEKLQVICGPPRPRV